MSAMMSGGLRGLALLFLMVLVLVGVVGVALMGMEGQMPVPAVHRVSAPAMEWTGSGENVMVPPGMTIKWHANKHNGQVLDAWKIYGLLLEGQCVASAVFCGPSDIEKLYLCMDPGGSIGGLIVFGDEILTGYQADQDYWARKVDKPEWEVCGE